MSLNRIAKRARFILGGFQIGRQLEEKIINSKKSYYSPPIFIIGLPRSGSTLLYQLITHHFKVSYFSNLSSFFFSYPATVTFLTLLFHKKFNIKSFQSKFGFTYGIFAPSEAGAIYRYWFDGSKPRTQLFRQTCNKITDLMKRPFVWKNLNLSYEIDRIYSMYSNALFVLVERDLDYTRTVDGPGLGIKGLTKNDLMSSSDLLKVVVEHIKKMNDQIYKSLKNDNINLIKVRYSDLCQDYSNQLTLIERLYASNDYFLERKNEFSYLHFKIEDFQKLTNPEWEYLLHLIRN